MVGSLDKDTYQRMAVFQYMIGNTGSFIPNKHNIEMIKVPNVTKVILSRTILIMQDWSAPLPLFHMKPSDKERVRKVLYGPWCYRRRRWWL